mmetsp:Transcript_72426/g.189820  ORF Transcript_72426/g.189820 Transcript_72426/m.189820 type:complete len:256 (-) Transcript_72426:699-1466(-)
MACSNSCSDMRPSVLLLWQAWPLKASSLWPARKCSSCSARKSKTSSLFVLSSGSNTTGVSGICRSVVFLFSLACSGVLFMTIEAISFLRRSRISMRMLAATWPLSSPVLIPLLDKQRTVRNLCDLGDLTVCSREFRVCSCAARFVLVQLAETSARKYSGAPVQISLMSCSALSSLIWSLLRVPLRSLPWPFRSLSNVRYISMASLPWSFRAASLMLYRTSTARQDFSISFSSHRLRTISNFCKSSVTIEINFLKV